MNINPTLPPGRDLLAHAIFDRKMASTDPRYNVKTCSLVYIDSKEAGVITLQPVDFVRKYWVGQPLARPDTHISFVGHNFTLDGTIAEFVDWANRDMIPGVPCEKP